MTTASHKHGDVRRAWRLLGLAVNPCYEDIRAAYYSLAVTTHPDRCSDPKAKERFQMLHAAYELAIETNRTTALVERCTERNGLSDFDWRAEAARVRSSYKDVFDCSHNFDACRKQRGDAYSHQPQSENRSSGGGKKKKVNTTTTKKNGGGDCCKGAKSAMQQWPGDYRSSAECAVGRDAGMHGRKSANVALQEECRLTAISLNRRRRQMAATQELLRRITFWEAAHRRVVMVLEQSTVRLITLVFSEKRIRHALEKLESAAFREMYRRWSTTLPANDTTHHM